MEVHFTFTFLCLIVLVSSKSLHNPYTERDISYKQTPKMDPNEDVKQKCSSCLETLQNCLEKVTSAKDFITGKKSEGTCQCCSKYNECIGELQCELIPSACFSLDCTNREYIGWIAIGLVILIVLAVLSVFYCYYQFKDTKTQQYDSFQNQKILDMKVADVKMFRQLDEANSSTTSSSSSSEDNDNTSSSQPSTPTKLLSTSQTVQTNASTTKK